jgi:hypothetical protein
LAFENLLFLSLEVRGAKENAHGNQQGGHHHSETGSETTRHRSPRADRNFERIELSRESRRIDRDLLARSLLRGGAKFTGNAILLHFCPDARGFKSR